MAIGDGQGSRDHDRARSPQMVRAALATQAAWTQLHEEFGLLDAAQIEQMMPDQAVTAGGSEALHAAGGLIGARSGGTLTFPAYQFGPDGLVYPWVRPLRALAIRAGWSEPSLVLWVITPNGRLGGRRPVEFVDDPDKVLEVAQASFDVSW